MKVQCLREISVISQCPTQESIGYDISAAYNCVIPAKGKGVVQTGLTVSVPSVVYANIAPRLGLAIKKSIDMGTRVIDNNY